MKTLDFTLKSILAFSIFGGMLLTSCSEGTDESMANAEISDSAENGEVNDSLFDIDTNQVLAWNSMRQHADSVKACFSELTNYFLLGKPDSLVDSIYVYIGYDAKKGTISLFPIASTADIEGNLKCFKISKLIKGSMEALPVTVAIDTTREDYITLADAKIRVGRWMDTKTRDNWITAVCKDKNKDYMGQIFVINTVDMVHRDEHKCYLSLRADADAVGGYRGDLIIVNTRTHEILQPAPIRQGELSGVIEDVVRLVPPFKPIEKSDFGLLKTLGLK